jgi:hypothetical protein
MKLNTIVVNLQKNDANLKVLVTNFMNETKEQARGVSITNNAYDSLYTYLNNNYQLSRDEIYEIMNNLEDYALDDDKD